MSFFAVQYRVLFHDTMAYGSHHFLTNFKFQCFARETLFFEHVVEYSQAGRRDHENLILLTQQGYTRNLAPVQVGERVTILISAEDIGRSSVRMCFRVIKEDGTPVCCGYQTLVCVDKVSGQMIAAPDSINRGHNLMREALDGPDFATRVQSGRLRQVFPEALKHWAAAFAQSSGEAARPQFVEIEGLKSAIPHHPAKKAMGQRVGAQERKITIDGPAFTFAGQGSFSPPLLVNLAAQNPRIHAFLKEIEAISRRLLGASFLDCLFATVPETAFRAQPDLVQLGMYATAIASAWALESSGHGAALAVGHSAGELAALAYAGVMSPQDGAEIICHRVLALRHCADNPGAMAVLTTTRARAQAVIGAIGADALVVAVTNHDLQVVLSGPEADIQRVLTLAPQLGLGARRVESTYGFHSPLLARAQAPFEAALKGYTFNPPRIPLYSPMEGRYLTATEDYPRLLASHFIRPLAYQAAVNALVEQGVVDWLECGPAILTKIGQKIRRDDKSTCFEAPLATLQSKESEISPRGAEVVSAQIAERSATKTARTRKSPPIAIIAMGCRVPGGENARAFWNSLLRKENGLHRATQWDAHVQGDFHRPLDENGRPMVDKTYTLLGGFIADAKGERQRAHGAKSYAETFMSAALEECLSGIQQRASDGKRTQVLLGATADGIAEYDEALLAQDLLNYSQHLGLYQPGLESAIDGIFELDHRALEALMPHRHYQSIIENRVGKKARLHTLDAACASSLYSVILGAIALERGKSDLVIAGGVFAPGPANSCLFSQFRGLSDTGSRPFDAQADGVVFGEGAAFVALKRLEDAQRDGEEILGVIGGYGLGSDGRSPSVAVPKKQGQAKTIRRAYAHAQIELQDIQAVEAHATSTPVGDSVEFSALHAVFADLPKKSVYLGSVKANTGHTGWAAGTTSLIKMVMAMGARTIPPQASFTQANGKIHLAESAFKIPQEAEAWPEPREGQPRRCALNSFGFGGTNAHLILESYHPDYHNQGVEAESQNTLVVVGVDQQLARADGPVKKAHLTTKIPPKMIILPDVVDDMDEAQKLALALSHDLMTRLGPALAELKDEIGIVLGFEGKTTRGRRITQRLHRDRLLRQLRSHDGEFAGYYTLLRGLIEQYFESIPASGPYTLPGMMPNVIAGRVANQLGLHGPNLVVGMGEDSLWQALETAVDLIQGGCAKLCLVGALNGAAKGMEVDASGEGMTLLALTSRAVAQKHGLNILSTFDIAAEDEIEVHATLQAQNAWSEYGDEIRGSQPILSHLKSGNNGANSAPLFWPGRGHLSFVHRQESVPKREKEAILARGILGPETPVERLTPQLVHKPKRLERSPDLGAGKTLFLIAGDDEHSRSQILAHGLGASTLLSAGHSTHPAVISVDLRDEKSAQAGLSTVTLSDYSRVIVMMQAQGEAEQANPSREASALALLDLLFLVCKASAGRLADGSLSIAALTLAMDGVGPLDPITGLFGGFLKSIKRENPKAKILSLIHEAQDLSAVMETLSGELEAQSAQDVVEVVYRIGRRFEERLVSLGAFSHKNTAPTLRKGAVVMATGGARGVTAVLATALAKRFGAKICLLGRSDPHQLPEAYRGLSLEALESQRADFYKTALAGDKKRRITDLKRQFDGYLSALEVANNIAAIEATDGSVIYRICDVNQAEDVRQSVAFIREKWGDVELLVHGAGLQKSGALSKRPLHTFRRIIGTKVQGLRHFEQAFDIQGERRPHIHILTSAFSYLGNDGQPDYGAANDYLGRYAEFSTTKAGMSAMAWLGWAGVGMTRGSEYAQLAASRRLKALLPNEGAALFLEAFEGRQTAQNMIQLTEGERRYYQVLPAIDRPHIAQLTEHYRVDTHPYLRAHRISGTPTLPGTFEADFAARIARKLMPEMYISEMRNIRLHRFVKVFEGREMPLQAQARVVEVSGAHAWVKVELYSDNRHPSGLLLEGNRLHFEAWVGLVHGDHIAPIQARGMGEPSGPSRFDLDDPYTLKNGAVELSGMFAALRELQVGGSQSHGRFIVENDVDLTALDGFTTPALLLDALFRFAMIQTPKDGKTQVNIPLSCRRALLKPGVVDADLQGAQRRIHLRASQAYQQADGMHSDWAEAVDESGQVILQVEGLYAHPYKTISIPNRRETIPHPRHHHVMG